jgi:biopolymer transport protein ExbD
MNIRRGKKTKIAESSASSDIAFLLIIYFIVIAGFNINKGFLLDLPAKDSAKLVIKDDLLRAELDKTGIIMIEERQLGRAEAEMLIRGALRTNPNLALLLTIDPGTSWQNVVSFVELARKLDIDSFSFSMRKTPGDA